MSPFLLLSLAYLVSLPFALTAGGGQAAHRSWSFTYVGVSIVAGFGVQHLARMGSRWPGWARLSSGAVGCVAIAALCVGNIASGESVLYRFPGPYVFGSDTRSMTPDLMAAAKWANAHLPAGSKVLSDRTSNEVLTGYTDLFTATPTDGGAYDLYYSGPDISPFVRQLLARDGFQYFLLDPRVETQVPGVTPFPGYTGLWGSPKSS